MLEYWGNRTRFLILSFLGDYGNIRWEREGYDMLDVIVETLVDALKLLPFLFVAFFLIELLEHKFYTQSKKFINKAGRLGPLIGGILGVVPQCGFSVMATNLYVTRIITMGTLVSVYLSTSDEMLPILLAHGSDVDLIVKILLIKLGIGVISGFIIDLFMSRKLEPLTHDFCENEHCHCENGLFMSSIKHTAHILLFILLVSFGINILVEYGGGNYLRNIFSGNSIFSSFLASLIGLIPNCCASVVLTELYLNGVIPFSCVIAGLLTGSGVALLVLFKSNKNLKDNIKILLLVYLIGAFSGVLLELLKYFF